jgi:hypothetical protein
MSLRVTRKTGIGILDEKLLDRVDGLFVAIVEDLLGFRPSSGTGE